MLGENAKLQLALVNKRSCTANREAINWLDEAAWMRYIVDDLARRDWLMPDNSHSPLLTFINVFHQHLTGSLPAHLLVMERHALFRGNGKRTQYLASRLNISNEAAYLRRLLNESGILRIEMECIEALISDYHHRIACWDYLGGARSASKLSVGLLASYFLIRLVGPKFFRAREVSSAKGFTLITSLGMGIQAFIYLVKSLPLLTDRKSPRARLRAISNSLPIETKEIFNRLSSLLDISSEINLPRYK
jgi:hypothetical protein